MKTKKLGREEHLELMLLLSNTKRLEAELGSSRLMLRHKLLETINRYGAEAIDVEKGEVEFSDDNANGADDTVPPPAATQPDLFDVGALS